MYIIDIILNPYALLWDGLHRSCFMPDLGLQLQRQSDGRMPSPAFVLVLGRRLQYYVNLRISMYIYTWMWGDVTWGDVTWCDVRWCDVMWRDVMWGDVRWGDMTWRDVRWGDVIMSLQAICYIHTHYITLHHTTMIDRWSRNKHIV